VQLRGYPHNRGRKPLMLELPQGSVASLIRGRAVPSGAALLINDRRVARSDSADTVLQEDHFSGR